MKALAITIRFLACFIMPCAIVTAQSLIPPQNLSVDQISSSMVSFSWEYPAAGHEGFLVERSPSATSDFQVIADLGPDVLQFTDTTMEQGQSYLYRVKAYNTTEASAYTPTLQGPPVIHIMIDDMNKIMPRKAGIDLDISGTAEFDYLKVESGNKYASVKLGYDEFAVYTNNPLPLSSGEFQWLDITLKSFAATTNWDAVEFRLNDQQGVKIGDYIDDAIPIGDGWLKVRIPLADFAEKNNVQFISFPHIFNANLGVREITFSGSRSLQWLGEEKYDNAIKENVAGQSRKIFSTLGAEIEEVQIRVINQGTIIKTSSMPFKSGEVTLSPGENTISALMIDTNGMVYYSDTAHYNVPGGPLYTVQPVTCHGSSSGGVDLTMQGGTPPYQFLWSNGADTEDISNVPEGHYMVHVTDANNKTAEIGVYVPDYNPLAASVRAEDCTAETSTLEVSGGKAPYSYSIDGGPFQSLGTASEQIWRLNGITSSWHLWLKKVVADKDDNLYFSGVYDDNVVFGKDTIGIDGQESIYLAKASAGGDFQWGITFTGYGQVIDLAVDDDGSSVMAFRFYRQGGEMLTKKGSVKLKEGGYFARFDAKGNLDWIHKMPQGISNVGIDGLHHVYAIGRVSGNFFNDPSFEHIRGETDMFLAKYDANATLLWVKPIQGRNGEVNGDMFITPVGDIFLTGGFETDISFGGLKLQSTDLMDAYVARLNSDGEPVWATQAGGIRNDDRGAGIVVDNKSNVYIIAHFRSNSSTFGNTTFDGPVMVLANLNALDGAIRWAKSYVRIQGMPGFDIPYEVALSSEGYLYITGETAWSDINTGAGYEPYIGSYLLKCDSTGMVLNRETLGSYSYGEKFNPLVFTRDNHLVNTDYNSGLAIVKRGAAMRRKIPVPPGGGQVVVVQDANSCTATAGEESPGTGIEKPAICYITSAVNGDGNRILWKDLPKQNVASYNIYRESLASEDYQLVGSTSGAEHQFLDKVNTLERSYRYKVSAVDGCGTESEMSEPHKTVHLTVNKGLSGQVNLLWEAYEGFDYKTFKIYRGSAQDQLELLATVPSGMLSYTDVKASPATAYYQVRVKNDQSCRTNVTQRGAQKVLAQEGETVQSNVVTNFGTADNLTFYPNPGTDKISLKFDPDGDEYQLTMIDANGRVVTKQEGVFDRAVLHRNNLPPGIYTVILQKNNGEPLRGLVVFQ